MVAFPTNSCHVQDPLPPPPIHPNIQNVSAASKREEDVDTETIKIRLLVRTAGILSFFNSYFDSKSSQLSVCD